MVPNETEPGEASLKDMLPAGAKLEPELPDDEEGMPKLMPVDKVGFDAGMLGARGLLELGMLVVGFDSLFFSIVVICFS